MAASEDFLLNCCNFFIYLFIVLFSFRAIVAFFSDPEAVETGIGI